MSRIPPREYRVNHRIRVPEVRLVDERGEQLGVMQTREAIEIADERGLDLVEVAPTARPPVCRIMDYGKFKYDNTRKEREARKARKAKAMQEQRDAHPELGMQLLRTVANDLVDEALLERPPAFEGRFLAMTLVPNPNMEKSTAPSQEKEVAQT